MNKSLKKIILYINTCFICIICFGQENVNFIKLEKSFKRNSRYEQDKHGFIWITNNDGIYKYDGYDFNKISYDAIFEENFTEDTGFSIAKDNKENLWVFSAKGQLTKIEDGNKYTSFKDSLSYNKRPKQISVVVSRKNNVWFGSTKGTIYRYSYDLSKIDSIITLPKINKKNQIIRSLAFTSSNKLWISTSGGVIYSYNLNIGKLEQLQLPFSGYRENIELVADRKGVLWIATEYHGLLSYDLASDNQFKQYNNSGSSSLDLKFSMFISIYCDSNNVIWAGTDGDGLYRINPEKDEITNFRHQKSNKFSISDNTITNINEDFNGNIWIVAKDGKLNISPKSNHRIKYYNGLENDDPMRVLSMIKASDGSVWIGTDGEGLNRVFENKSKVQYNSNNRGEVFFKGRYIQSIVEDKNQNIWIATYQNGLWVYNSKLNTFNKIKVSDSKDRISSDIRTLFKDSKDRIWVGSEVGVHVFSSNQKLLAIFDYNSNGLLGKYLVTMCEDEYNNVWLGLTIGGLYKFNEDIDSIGTSFFSKEKSTQRINNINSLNSDKDGSLWISNSSGYLFQYDFKSGNLKPYNENQIFKDLVISSVLIENSQSVWLSTSSGVYNYDVKLNTMKSFNMSDGFQSNSFVKRSSHKGSNGNMYFGSDVGLNVFNPSFMDKREALAKLYVTEIDILNKPANLLIPNQLAIGVENLNELKLKANQSSFAFKFSAVENVLAPNYYYAYKLEGFDKEWVVPKQDRVASYTNIPYGNYTFEVKAGSKKGVWDIESKKINIYIKAPWWYSVWAILSYFIFIFFLGYGIYVWLRLRNKLKREAWHNNKEKELYDLKMNFFAKMSHEIQTPLTLISGPIEDMLSRAGTKGNKLLQQRLLMINNNVKRLSRIATDLMAVRNNELDMLKIYASKNNFTKHLKDIALSFAEQARFKNIDFIQKFPQEDINIWYDIDKIEHVFYNLLSNAFKFTPKEGNITLNIASNIDNEFIEIAIKDSGPGIPEEDLENIFELFYQSSLGKKNKGFGIGLAFTKELISLHKGGINVDSSSESGTTFVVKLSKSETIFSEEEKVILDSSNSIEESREQNIEALKDFSAFPKASTQKAHTVLIVEDNVEMQIFLRDLLNKNYTVLIAENGVEGLKQAEKSIPDLILSDVMMPIMGGIEMSAALQKNKRTLHVPIILLTAKNTTKTKIEGLQSGAIEYIQKPFNVYELLLKINNIIESKEKILSKYKTNVANSPKEGLEKSKDELFLEELVNELNKHIEDPDFKLETLTGRLNMSYSVIYRKCQEITSMTLVEFVRSIKMKRALILIVKNGYNVNEAAFAVGYRSLKYFRKCIKEEFKATPSMLLKEYKKIGHFDFYEKYSIIDSDLT